MVDRSVGTRLRPPRSFQEHCTARLCSRLCVACPASPSAREFGRFSQIALLLLLSRSILCSIARKMRTNCNMQKAIFLCFQVLLSFVPTIQHFSRCPVFPTRGIRTALSRQSARPRAPQRQNAHNTTTIIGYHAYPSLSSGKCAKRLGVRRLGAAFRHRTLLTPRLVGNTRRRQAAALHL